MISISRRNGIDNSITEREEFKDSIVVVLNIFDQRSFWLFHF